MEVLFERRYYDAGRGTWSSYGVDWGTWYSSKGERGTEPPQDMKDCMVWYDQMHETGDLAKQKALMDKILDNHKKNLWVIGTVSFPDGFAIVSDRLKNVPDWWWRSWMYPNPAPINMMQLYIEE
jgi:ABC-type transport system substrate-binding protein